MPPAPTSAESAAGHRTGVSRRATQPGRSRSLASGETFAANDHKGLPHGPIGFGEPAAYRDFPLAILFALPTLPIPIGTVTYRPVQP